MTPFKVTCEHCEASFKIGDASKIGKRVKCPKCAEPFTIRAPEDVDDDFDDDEFDAPAAKPSRRGPVKKSSAKGQKSGDDGPPMMAWVGGSAAAVVLVIGGLWASGMLGGGTPPQPVVALPPAPPPPSAPITEIINRLPANTEVVMHFRVKDAIASPLAAGLRTPEFDAQLRSPNPLIPGTTLTGINSITVALSDITLGLSEQIRLAAGSGTPLPPGGMPFPVSPIVIVTLNDPITPDFLNFPAESVVKHGSATIYRRPAPLMPGTPPCLTIVEPKIVVLGTESQVKALLAQSAPSGLANDFGFVDGQAHAMLAICPRGIVQQVERLAVNGIESPQLHRELHQFAAKGGKAMGLSLSLTSELEAGVTLVAADAAKSADVQSVLETHLKMMRDSFATGPVASNPLLASLKPIADAIKVASNGDRILASTIVPKETLMNLGQSALAMAGPMMMNMGGPPGGPPDAPGTAPMIAP